MSEQNPTRSDAPPNRPSAPASRDLSGPTAQTWLWLFACVGLALTAWLAFRLDVPSLLSAALLLAALGLLIFFLLFRLPATWKEWVIEHGVIAVGVVLSLLLGLAMLLWLVVNFSWAAEDERTHVQTATWDLSKQCVANTGADATLSLSYPAVALFEPNMTRLDLGLRASCAVTETAVAVTLPNGLVFAADPAAQTRAVTATIGVTEVITTPLEIINLQTLRNTRPTATIEVALPASLGAPDASLRAPIAIEGQRGFAVRRFVTSTIDEASPLIWLLLLALPGLAALAQKVIDERYAALKQRRQEEFDLLEKQFREELRAGSLEAAGKTLDHLAREDYRDWNQEAKVLARELLDLARLQFEPPNEAGAAWPDRSILQKSHRWSKEFTEAYVLARRTLKDKDKLYLAHYLKLGIPEAALNQLDKQLTEFVQEARFHLQYQEFADDPALTMKLAAWASDHDDMERIQPPTPLTEPGDAHYRIRQAGLTIPFDRGDASHPEDARFLLAGGFYGPEALLGPLRALSRPTIVHGPPGCGRTALFTLFPFQRSSPEQLPVKLSGRPTAQQAAAVMAGQLLRFILLHPSYLVEYGPGQRQFLARLLVEHLSARVIPTIDRAQIEIGNIGALDTPEKRELARLRLEEFKRILLATVADGSPAPAESWADDLLEAAAMLGFRQVTFVYDANGGEDLSWLLNFVLGRLDSHPAVPVIFCLFAPNGHDLLAHLDGLPQLDFHPLTWGQTDKAGDDRLLRQMVAWRFETFQKSANPSQPQERGERALLGCFEEGEKSFDLLISHSHQAGAYNPRRFMTLWHAAVGNKTIHEKITHAEVEAAIK